MRKECRTDDWKWCEVLRIEVSEDGRRSGGLRIGAGSAILRIREGYGELSVREGVEDFRLDSKGWD